MKNRNQSQKNSKTKLLRTACRREMSKKSNQNKPKVTKNSKVKMNLTNKPPRPKS